MRMLRLILLLSFVGGLVADEGMWPYNRLPLEQLKEQHSFEPTAGWIDRLQRGSVRLNNGGSGSFVSPTGLVMTNHHVAADCIRKLSSEEKDYIADGFYASSRQREMKCPDLELNVLMEIETVTERVNRNVRPEMSDADKLEAQKAEIARMTKDCRDSTLMRCDVVNLYQGGIFDLYKYKRYDDVRLVFAPEFAAAFFGGDPDNFTYPRYCLDVSFLRVYEDGQPIASPSYLPFSKEGAAEQELVFVSGHPGSTRRLLTESQLRFERDRRMPFLLDWLHGMADAIQAYGRSGGDAARLSRDQLFSLDNSIKAYTGRLAGLRRPDLFQSKVDQEKQLRDLVSADEENQKKFGDAWDKIAGAQSVKSEIYEEYRLLEGLGFYSRYYTIAKHLYRMSQELPKPNEDRLEEYRESGLVSLNQQIYSPAPIYPELEVVKLDQSLKFLRDRLGRNHPVVAAVLGNKRPDAAAKALVDSTGLADVEFRRSLGEDNAAAAKTSDDAMIAMVRSVDEAARALRKRYEDEVEAVETANGGLIAQARFAAFGESVYPDATFSLRLSIGLVRAYLDEGKRVAPFTDFDGLYAKATGEDPYILAKKLLQAKKRIKGETPYNLVSTNDITGGNSGSPLINSDGEVVGLIFDGNIQSLSNDFLYSDRQARAVSVDTRGILAALRHAYNARRVVSEITSAQAQQ